MLPTGTEVCDGYDNDCSGTADFTDEVDVDTDNYFVCTGYVDQDGADAFLGGEDCDDTDTSVFTGAPELCDGQLNNCGGAIGAGEVDADSDQYVVCALDAGGWDGAGTVVGGEDCVDTGTGGAGTAANLIFPLAGDAVASDSEDRDCDGFDCLAGDTTLGGAFSAGPYFVFCAPGTLVDNPDAIADCVLGGHDGLAEPQDGTETALLATLTTTGTPWIGLNDASVDGTFVWDSGATPLPCNTGAGTTPYCNWATSQPDDGASASCVTANPSGEWADKPCTELNAYSCETR